MKLAQDIILKPIITEQAMDGISAKKYTFKVASDATKPEIANAVEVLFGVKVADVNTINMKGKPKRVRYNAGHTANWTKAVVTLTSDSKTIEFFEGMN